MTEDLLHFIWKFRLLRPGPLCTSDGSPLEIVHPGLLNVHAGPDFSNGRMKLQGMDWCGNIEIHRRSSEWELHGHQHDAAYASVILHVVYEHDREVFTSEGRTLPTLELRHFLEDGILERYEALYRSRQEIACGESFGACAPVVRAQWLDRMLVERLEEKVAAVRELFHACEGNWEQTFYRLLARNFGFRVNAEPMLILARIAPLQLLLRHADNPLQVEALLFGQAGLLEESFQDPYPASLQREYRFLKHKYQLAPMLASAWKFSRMRPGNFPTVRIAQLASFITRHRQCLSVLFETKTLEEAGQFFATAPNSWWDTHYTFSVRSTPLVKKPGKASIDTILINTLCPLLFTYGKERSREDLCAKALDWLTQLEAEENTITRIYGALGFKGVHAGHSQALYHLYGNYCTARKCLSCSIGAQALQQVSLTSA